MFKKIVVLSALALGLGTAACSMDSGDEAASDTAALDNDTGPGGVCGKYCASAGWCQCKGDDCMEMSMSCCKADYYCNTDPDGSNKRCICLNYVPPGSSGRQRVPNVGGTQLTRSF